MTTPRQFASNGRNAQKSTGPRTAAGREKSSRNSLRHGICADKYLLSGEEEDFQQLLDALREHWKPATALEERQVSRIAICMMRLDRGARGEAAVIADTPLHCFFRGDLTLKNLLHYETVNRKGLRFEIELLERMQAQRLTRVSEAGAAEQGASGEENRGNSINRTGDSAPVPGSLDRQKGEGGSAPNQPIVQTNPMGECLEASTT